MPMKARVTNANGGIVGVERNGAYRQHLHDALGSTIALVDASGAVTDTYTYWPYGTVRSSTGTTENPYKFCGKWGYYEDAPGRAYVRARTLRQDLGRWMTVDPLWPNEHAYRYVRCTPITLVDEYGLAPAFPGFSMIDLGMDWLWRMLCPPVPKESRIRPCSAYGARCPHGEGGLIDFRKFAEGDSSRGRPGSPEFEQTKCDPKEINRSAIERRRDFVAEMVDRLCSQPRDATIPGDGYEIWATTIPCWRLLPNGERCLSFKIDCHDVGHRLTSNYFKGERDYRGLGCMLCCLLRHEATHGCQILAGRAERTYGAECEGWKAELACLNRVLAGQKC
jgi:RHS repeat-associated protein